MNACSMPACPHPATTTNRAKQDTCAGHVTVVVSGSWVTDRHNQGSGE